MYFFTVSFLYILGRLDIKMDPKIWREKYSAWNAYGDSKLANSKDKEIFHVHWQNMSDIDWIIQIQLRA